MGDIVGLANGQTIHLVPRIILPTPTVVAEAANNVAQQPDSLLLESSNRFATNGGTTTSTTLSGIIQVRLQVVVEYSYYPTVATIAGCGDSQRRRRNTDE